MIIFETEIEKKKRKKLVKTNNDRAIKDSIIRDTTTLFQQQEEKGYYKPKRVSYFWNNIYIEYESNGDRNLSIDDYLNRIETYLKNIIMGFQNSDTWNTQLTIAINFISSKDVEEESVLHSRSENIKFKSYNNANEVVDELFESLRSTYQGNLETSIRGKDFIFDSVPSDVLQMS